MTQTTLPGIHEQVRGPHGRVGGGAAAGSARPGTRRSWPLWVLLVVLAFIALESLLLALALKGRWLILLAPAAVCASKGLELWRELRAKARE